MAKWQTMHAEKEKARIAAEEKASTKDRELFLAKAAKKAIKVWHEKQEAKHLAEEKARKAKEAQWQAKSGEVEKEAEKKLAVMVAKATVNR